MNQINNEIVSLIKDKEFILFKIALNKFYYFTVIILSYALLKHNSLFYLLDFNIYFYLFLLLIFILYFVLLSNFFTIKLFFLYLNFKIYFNYLNEINIDFNNINIVNKTFKKSYLRTQIKTFSTFSRTRNNNLSETEDYDPYSESSILNFRLDRNKAIKEFKKTYKGGYLGYNLIHFLGNISHLIH
jgi:small-conductance mechanosensitive channel